MEAAIMETTVRSAPARRLVCEASMAHGRALWLSGWGQGRFRSFADYMQTIPSLPPAHGSSRAQGLARLCEPFLIDGSLSLVRACRMLGFAFAGDDSVFVDMVHDGFLRDVRWAWWSAQALSVCAAAGSLQGFSVQESVVPLTAFEGACLLAQDRSLLQNGRWLVCAGSWMNSSPRYRACFCVQDGEPALAVVDFNALPPERFIPGRVRV